MHLYGLSIKWNFNGETFHVGNKGGACCKGGG